MMGTRKRVRKMVRILPLQCIKKCIESLLFKRTIKLTIQMSINPDYKTVHISIPMTSSNYCVINGNYYKFRWVQYV